MTAPGGSSGEGADSVPASPWAGDQPPDQPVSGAPWASPASPTEQAVPEVRDYPATQEQQLPGYPPPLPYPGGYQPEPGVGYPAFPQSGYPPPGYQPYPPPPPMPNPYGATPGAYPGAYPGGFYPPADYGGYGGGYGGGYSGGYGYGAGYGTLQSGMNTMAIVSLVSAIIGIFCCVSSIVGIVCGAIGLNQIKQTREDGYGLAIAGIVISVATVLVYFVVMAVSAGR